MASVEEEKVALEDNYDAALERFNSKPTAANKTKYLEARDELQAHRAANRSDTVVVNAE
jgi:hypothetical protein